jgi:membrane fusion protein, multidrug efflux system
MSDTVTAPQEPTAKVKKRRTSDWAFPLLRVLLVTGAAFLAWYVAGHWNRWTGAARYESTDDAYTFGDLTPLSANLDFSNISVHRGRESEKDVVLQQFL